MKAKTDDIRRTVDDFLAKLKNPPTYKMYEIINLTEFFKKKDWGKEWASHVGVYVFEKDGEVQYVGRALKNVLLGKRVWENGCEKNVFPPEWSEIVKSPDTTVVVLAFDNEGDDFWVASLEIYLIDHFDLDKKKKWNKRRG